MTRATKKVLAYAPLGAFLVLDVWAFTTGTYASERDRVLPYLFFGYALLYMLPSIIAAHRDHSRFGLLWTVNFFGGALFCAGWAVAVIWAFVDPKRANRGAPAK